MWALRQGAIAKAGNGPRSAAVATSRCCAPSPRKRWLHATTTASGSSWASLSSLWSSTRFPTSTVALSDHPHQSPRGFDPSVGLLSPHHQDWDTHQHQRQQVRWKRKDGNKAFDKPRPPTKKQRKAYNRKLQSIQEEEARKSPPGSKAGLRREYLKMVKDDLLGNNPELGPTQQEQERSLLEYGEEDALLDDLMGNTSHVTAQPTPQPEFLGHRHDHYHNLIVQIMAAPTTTTTTTPVEASSNDEQGRGLGGDDDASLAVTASDPAAQQLPPDELVTLALRSFRDKHGTRQKPIGLSAALEYLLQTLQLPVSMIRDSDRIITALLSCCRTPAEGRKVEQLVRGSKNQKVSSPERRKQLSSYAWSALIDLYGRVGDWEGCHVALHDMRADGHVPTLAACTSTIAAIARVCRNGRIAKPIRAEAANRAWELWHAFRVEGNEEPDVMSYGALLQLCAAIGQPERAVSILEEMEQLQIKPTTYCFACALRAVARSHATAIRYENGSSRRNLRRETLTKHHGRMAREIVIKAENAEVKQDDGFVSALILCAASAGDAATAKAIYVASQIRRLDHLRTIGPDAHLARLRGENWQEQRHQQLQQLAADPSGAAASVSNETSPTTIPFPSQPTSWEEREYGKDSRTLSAVLHACAQALHSNGIGTLWQGRENGGYLCDNSLRLLVARKVPQYADTAIPGLGRTDDLTWEGEHDDDNYRDGKRRSRKFKGVDFVKDHEASVLELDDTFSRLYLEEDGQFKKEFRKTTPEDMWRMKYGPNDDTLAQLDSAKGKNATGSTRREQLKLELLQERDDDDDTEEEKEEEDEDELYFDYDTMRWKTRGSQASATRPIEVAERSSNSASTPATSLTKEVAHVEEEESLFFNSDTLRWESQRLVHAEIVEPDHGSATGEANVGATYTDDVEEELYFDIDAMRWKTRIVKGTQLTESALESQARTEFEDSLLPSSRPESNLKTNNQGNDDAFDDTDHDPDTPIDEAEFAKFFHELQMEIQQSGDDYDHVKEEEARELYLMMKDEYNDVLNMDPDELAKALTATDLSEVDLSQMDDSEESPITPPSDPESISQLNPKAENFQRFIEDIKDEWRSQGASLDEDEIGNGRSMQYSGDRERQAMPLSAVVPERETHPAWQGTATHTMDLDQLVGREKSQLDTNELILNSLPSGMKAWGESVLSDSVSRLHEPTSEDQGDLDELRSLLPAFSNKRLRRIRKAFRTTLTDPSLLDLVPLVRERLPDYITNTWLKQMSSLTARYVVHKASQDGLVDVHMLNGALELETLSGSLDRALDFYETEFDRQGIEANQYSDRLVLQMFVNNGRFPRALAFKDSLVERGRLVDLHSYGSLIEYSGRHHQVGSALLLLKECLSVHGAPPGEASLAPLRRLCRKNDALHQQLEGLIGPDPVAWLREGEAHLKREMSKKGRRDVQMARNRLVHL